MVIIYSLEVACISDASLRYVLHCSTLERIKAMNQVLLRARGQLYDCSAISKMLRAMVQSAEEQANIMKKQTTFLSQLAANTLPKSLHCFSLQLTVNYYKLPKDEREFSGQHKVEDNSLFHYAIFTDNVLAASVVVNSTVSNAKARYRSKRCFNCLIFPPVIIFLVLLILFIFN